MPEVIAPDHDLIQARSEPVVSAPPTPLGEACARVARLAARALQVPLVFVVHGEGDQRAVLAAVGAPAVMAPCGEREAVVSLCARVAAVPLLVEDACARPLGDDDGAAAALAMCSIAGVRVTGARARALGVLCVGDHEPRRWSEADVATLHDLAALLSMELELLGAVTSRGGTSDRGRAESTVLDTRDAFRALVEASPLGIIACDLAHNVTIWNPAAERIFGWRAREVLKRPLPTISWEERAEHVALCAATLAGHSAMGVELRRLRRDGTPIYVSLSTAVLRDAGGEATGVLALLTDVTERKQLEEKFIQVQRTEAIGRLAGGVAHDFNNLLTAIKCSSNLLLEELAPDHPRRGDAEVIAQAAHKAAALTSQLLAFSRQQVMQPRVLDLNAVVAEMEMMLCRVIGEDIGLVTLPSSDLGHVRADPGQLEQALMNLAVNARDAMPDGGLLTISTENVSLEGDPTGGSVPVIPGPYVLLKVSDTGCGIDKQIVPRIFEPFFTTKPRGQGTGLGLSTVYGVVKQSGGYIFVESQRGRGTTFSVYLPRVEQPLEGREPSAGPLTTLRGSETLLLVEDEDVLRGLVRRVLERHGYTVLEASDGEEALALCEQHDGVIHLVVSDVVMPRMGGRELAERLSAVRPELQVLYVSGYTDDDVVRHGLLDPRMAYLQKPFTPEALARKIREVLDHGSAIKS
jgi:two-component system, cell cycle sensor histidine kinase and response regulator CckA